MLDLNFTFFGFVFDLWYDLIGLNECLCFN